MPCEALANLEKSSSRAVIANAISDPFSFSPLMPAALSVLQGVTDSFGMCGQPLLLSTRPATSVFACIVVVVVVVVAPVGLCSVSFGGVVIFGQPATPGGSTL